MPGLDYPPPNEPISVDTFLDRWPGPSKIELIEGAIYFYKNDGPRTWDERDVAMAQRAFPGRIVRTDGWNLIIEPGEP